MIRFLQTDNRITKALFVVVIGAASVAMVVYLIPGLTGAGSAAPDTFAVVYPHWYSKILLGRRHHQRDDACNRLRRAKFEAARPAIR